jgi:hypothetical protein
MFGQLPAVFAFNGTHDALQIGQRSPTRFRTSKTRGDAGMEAFEFLPPLPHVNKSRCGSCRDDMLGLLHLLLLLKGTLGTLIVPASRIAHLKEEESAARAALAPQSCEHPVRSREQEVPVL